MWSTAREVAAGDTVIIWLTRDQVQPLVVTPGKDFNTKFGNFRQADFVGVPYGSKVASRTGRGFIHILRPTPELWTIALPHRTQILYLADIAFITTALGLRRGSKVIEAGTGSASFSHSVARTVGASGRLWSFEFHEARYRKAKEEFTRHGLDGVVTLAHRNVCKDGFGVVDEVDAVFLDLPAPWEAVEHAKKALRKDRPTRICCFSPCMEQVLRTVSALNEVGFTEITMYETLLRPIEVFQIPQAVPVSALSEKLKASEKKREEKRQRQIRANREKAAAVAGKEGKRKREAEGDGGGEEGDVDAPSKRLRKEDEMEEVEVIEEVEPMDEDVVLSEEAAVTAVKGEPEHVASSSGLLPASSTPPLPSTSQHPPPTKLNLAKALPEVRGHTSYLTFACLVPVPTHAKTPTAFSSPATASAETMVEAPTPGTRDGGPDGPCTT